jgi:hypothetical protein
MRDEDYEGMRTGEVAAAIAENHCGGNVHRMLRGDALQARGELCRVLHNLRGWSTERIDRYYGFRQGEAAARLRALTLAPPAAEPAPVPLLTQWEVFKAKRVFPLRSHPRVFTAEHKANLRAAALVVAERNRRRRDMTGRRDYDRAEHKRILSGG